MMIEPYILDDRIVEIPEEIRNMSEEERERQIAILEEAGRKEGEKHSRTYFADNLDWKYQLNKTDWGRGFLGLFLLFKKFCMLLMSWNINLIQKLLSECACKSYRAIFTD